MSDNNTNIYGWLFISIVSIVLFATIVIFMKKPAKDDKASPTPTSMVENFIQELYTATDESTSVLVKALTMPDQSEEVQKLIDQGTIDPSTVKAYKNALANYKSTLASYKL